MTTASFDLKRDPVMLIGLVLAALQACTLFFNFNTEAQGAVTALLAILAGAAQAWAVSFDKFLPFLTQIGQAVFVVVAAWNWDVPPNVQAGVMALLAVLSGAYLRTQLSPKVAPPVVSRTAGGPVSVTRQTGGTL